MKNYKNTQKGFISKILLIVIVLIIAKYTFDFDIIEWIKSPKVQNIIEKIIFWIKEIYFKLDSFVRSIVN